jgi:flagellar hook protein FlgE
MGGSALFTAVTGLQSFQSKLDVIANNIANVNTTGYRSSRILFQDLFSQTLSGGTAPDGVSAGTNPKQIGIGVRSSSIDVNHSQGALTATGVNSDLAIQGSGFFVLSDGTNQTFTRDGSFSLNRDGLLVDPATGLFVQGFSADVDGNVDVDAGVGNLTIPVGGASIVQPTTTTSLVGNLSAEAVLADALAVPPVPVTTVTRTIRTFDSLGVGRDVQLTFTKSAQLDDGGTLYNAWTYVAEFDGVDVTNTANQGAVIFNTDGSFRAIGDNNGGVFTAAAAGTPTVSVGLAQFSGPSIPDAPFEFEIDFTAVTELSGNSELTNPTQDGFPRGVLQEFALGENGIIIGVFTNGLTRTLGQVAMGTFSNLGGLTKIGNNQFRETPASGTVQIGVANTGGRGEIASGVLESSNVDLGTEFSDMIVTQRAFQANARTITTADNMLQEAVNLIR